MYNRYVPQADGSFRRSRIPEAPSKQEQPPRPAPSPQPEPVAQGQPDCVQPKQPAPMPHRQSLPPNPHSRQDQPASSVGSFLRGLLPQNFDTEDLMVVLLLLLMCGNSGTDQNAALLTLVIYLFL